MKGTDGRTVIRLCALLKSDKSTYMSLCDEIAIHFAPEMETLMEVSEGSEILQPIISTGIVACQKLQSGLYSNSMALGKGNLIDPDKRLMKLPHVKEWYATLSNETHHHIQQSTFSKQFDQWLGDYVPFGSGVMYVRWSPNTKRHVYEVHPENKCFYTYDADGEIGTMCREYELTAEQAAKEFGVATLTAGMKTCYDKQDVSTKFGFVHCMKENRNHDPSSRNKHKMRYESIHVSIDNGKVMHRSGSKRMRYVVEHFYQKHGERNGRSPTMQALPVIRTLMKTVSDFIDGTEMAIGPPLWLADRDAVETAILTAFGVNYADLSKGDPWMYKIDVGALRLSKEFIEWLKDEINQLFYVDLFAMLEQMKSGAKTAYEVQQMVAERTQAIAPIANALGRFFRTIYKLTAMDLLDAGMIDAPPADVSGEIDAQYTSRLDIRLKEIENVSMMEAVDQGLMLVKSTEESPQMASMIKVPETLHSIFEAHNVDPANIRTVDDAKKELNRIMEDIKAAQAAEQSANAIKPVDTQRAPEPGSPLGDMIDESAGSMIGQ